VAFVINLGGSMILLMRNLQVSLRTIVGLKDDNPKISVILIFLICFILDIPLIISCCIYSPKAASYAESYVIGVFGFLFLVLSFFTFKVIR
jgi:hypothetical protein